MKNKIGPSKLHMESPYKFLRKFTFGKLFNCWLELNRLKIMIKLTRQLESKNFQTLNLIKIIY